MTEKNTQNAVVPTKGTRQYKHTPKPPNRISKIFALVACLVLLVTFTIPVSATWISDPAGTEALDNLRYAPSLCPSAIGYSCLDDGVESVYYQDLDYTYYVTGETEQATTYYQYFSGDSFNGGTMYLRPKADYTELVLAPNPNAVNGVALAVSKFYYNDVSYNPSNLNYVPRVSITYSSATEVLYIVNGTYLDEDNVSRSFGVTFSAVSGRRITVPSIADIYASLGYPQNVTVTFGSIEIVAIPRYENENNVDVTADGYTVEFKPLTPLSDAEDIYYENISVIRYKEVVNSRTFSDMLDWLGDVLEGFLSTPLFKIGNLTISIAVILATILGLLFVFTFLRFFSGG